MIKTKVISSGNIILIAILIRLIIAPFFAHEDLINHYLKSFHAVTTGELYPASLGYLWYFVSIGTIKLYQLAGLNLTALTHYDPTTLIPNLPAIYASPNIHQLLFFLKLPFFLYELLAFYLIVKIISPAKTNPIITASFWLNPFSLYALYLHGRNSMLPLIFILLGIYSYSRNKFSLSALSLGTAIAMRSHPLFILPLFIKKILSKPRQLLISIFLLSTPIILDLSAANFFSSTQIVQIERAPLTSEHLIPASISVGYSEKIYLFPALIIFLLGYHLLHEQHSLRNIIRLVFSIYLIMLTLIFFHPHYFSWTVIMLPLVLHFFPHHTKSILSGVAIQTLGWLIAILYWGNGTTFGLLSPINFSFFQSIGSPLSLLGSTLTNIDIPSLGRTIIAASSLFLIFTLFKPAHRS